MTILRAIQFTATCVINMFLKLKVSCMKLMQLDMTDGRISAVRLADENLLQIMLKLLNLELALNFKKM